MSLELKWVFLF